MGIKMPNFVPLTAACPIFTVNRASQCDAYFHSGMPIFTVNIGIGMPIFGGAYFHLTPVSSLRIFGWKIDIRLVRSQGVVTYTSPVEAFATEIKMESSDQRSF